MNVNGIRETLTNPIRQKVVRMSGATKDYVDGQVHILESLIGGVDSKVKVIRVISRVSGSGIKTLVEDVAEQLYSMELSPCNIIIGDWAEVTYFSAIVLKHTSGRIYGYLQTAGTDFFRFIKTADSVYVYEIDSNLI